MSAAVYRMRVSLPLHRKGGEGSCQLHVNTVAAVIKYNRIVPVPDRTTKVLTHAVNFHASELAWDARQRT